jgi:hypothetical protein
VIKKATQTAATRSVSGIQAHPGGRFRRMIALRHDSPARVCGWLEDHFHHFGATIEHDGLRVNDVRMAAPRYPWTTCPGAGVPLKALIGKPLITRASNLGGQIDMRLQCTHVFDLVALLLVQAATQRPDRTYEVIVPDREVTLNPNARSAAETFIYGPGTVALYQDGRLAMQWQIDDRSITGPAPYSGQSVGAGFRQWTESMPEEEAEHATVARRALLVAGGRHQDLDQFGSAADQHMPAACHSFQPEQRNIGLRVTGSDRNYEDGSETMLSHLREVP